MSTQGQGDVVADTELAPKMAEVLRDFADQIIEMRECGTDNTESKIYRSAASLIDRQHQEIERLRTLLSSSRGEQGWRLVPEKPTEAMNIAAVDAYRKTALFSSIWEACLAAAPSAPGSVPTFAGQAPDGCVLVPKEPTEVMIFDTPKSEPNLEPSNVFSNALSAERARVIEECARVAGEKSAMLPHQNDFVRGYANGRADAAAALRALGQQDNGNK